PSDARLWIFAAARPLLELERRQVLDEVDAFLDEWSAHGIQLTASRDVRYDQFLFVAVDERAAGVSGCSIDALVRRMRQLQAALGVELVNNSPVFYRQGEAIVRVSRDEFADLATSGAVDLETAVFDNTVGTIGDVREGRWEVCAGDAWHR